MDNEEKPIKLLTNKIHTMTEKLILFEESPDDEEMVLLEMTIEGQKISCKNDNFFAALITLRKALEKKDIQIFCNGAAQNVYPSSMQLSMGYGRKAYKLYMGQQAKSIDIVDIFDCDESLNFVNIEEQLKFYDKWIKSIMNP